MYGCHHDACPVYFLRYRASNMKNMAVVAKRPADVTAKHFRSSSRNWGSSSLAISQAVSTKNVHSSAPAGQLRVSLRACRATGSTSD
jgi:hypothetical protein